MTEQMEGNESQDPFRLNRFTLAQVADYDRALDEIRCGQKRSHWIWYIFPQFAGLGFSAMSKTYAIASIAEAAAYLAHPLLGPRLTTCMEAAIAVPDLSARTIFGSPDDAKLKSCATLFAWISPVGSMHHRLLDRFFDGVGDPATDALLKTAVDFVPE